MDTRARRTPQTLTRSVTAAICGAGAEARLKALYQRCQPALFLSGKLGRILRVSKLPAGRKSDSEITPECLTS